MLAQQQNQTLDVLRALAPWAAALVALIVVLTAVTMLFRAWVRKSNDPFARQGFTVADLRELRDKGQLSPEEFDRAKALLASRSLAEGKDGEGLSDNSRQ